MQEYGALLEEDAIVVVRGRVDWRDEQPKLVAAELSRPELSEKEDGRPITVSLPLYRLTDSMVRQLKELVLEHRGACPVQLKVGDKQLRLPPQFAVDPRSGIIGALKELFGSNAVLP
jgi:DNA polymerase-3 subunit alpha